MSCLNVVLSRTGWGGGRGRGGELPLEAGVLLELLGRDCGHTPSDRKAIVYQVHRVRRSLRAEWRHGGVGRLVKGAMLSG